MQAPNPRRDTWWSDPRYLALLVLLSAVPLLWPALPPLVDAPGHLSRYYIQTVLAASPELQRYFSFEWRLIGNLGVDLLIMPLSAVFGLELSFKLIILTIPVLMATGLVLVARVVHGRATPFAAFALPLAYGFPFQFGFLNSCLATALALIALAGWITLSERGQMRLRAGLFIAIGLLLWVCHVFGWAELGLMVGACEFSRSRERGESWHRAALTAFLATAPLWPPLVLMLLWRADAAGATQGWFQPQKLAWLLEVLRSRWLPLDRWSAILLVAIIVAGAAARRQIGIARDLGWVAFALLLAFVLVPFKLLGSDLADMRIVPLMLAIGLIALRAPRNRPTANAVAVAALLFFLARTATVTADLAEYSGNYDRQLTALDHIPRGARVMVLSATPCDPDDESGRAEHLGGMAIVRRNAFTNDQFVLAGAQLMSVHYPAAGRFVQDPSQFIHDPTCVSAQDRITDQVIPAFPASAFDYLWVIDFPGAGELHRAGLARVWARADGAVYRIVSPNP